MTLTAFLLIFASASLHATWNMIAKKNHMTYPFYAMICLAGTVIFGHMLFWTPVQFTDLPAKYWIFIVLSVAADNLYGVALSNIYKYVEMSVAYPMMRSLPILFTLFVTTLFGLGKPISPASAACMGLVVAGCIMMPLKRFADFKPRNYFKVSMLFIIVAALGTTGYTVCDSVALEALRTWAAPRGISKTMMALSYYANRNLLLSSSLFFFSIVIPSQRKILAQYIRERNIQPFLAGVCAIGTYSLVLISMNYVTNVSYVQVFRQMGLPIGVFVGILFLKEKFTMPKLSGVTLIMLGLIGSVLWQTPTAKPKQAAPVPAAPASAAVPAPAFPVSGELRAAGADTTPDKASPVRK